MEHAHGPQPERRDVLSVGAIGIASLVLPSAAASASGESPPAGEPQGSGLSAPTGVTAVPIGYVSDDATGAIRVTWDAVDGATSYRVGWATVSSGNGPYTYEAAGTATSFDLVGRVGTDTIHHVVVEASDDSSAFTSTELTCSSVVATGGDVTTFVGNGTIGAAGTTYVVHTFATVGASSFTLNAPYALDHLIVGGGGGGGGCTGRGMCAGGGGGGGVVTGTRALGAATAGETLPVVVGAGGTGGGDIALVESPGVAGYATAGDPSSFDAVTALGGGAGGSAPFTGNADVGDPYALPTPYAGFAAERATGGGGVGQTARQLGASGNDSNGGNGTLSAVATGQRAGGGGGAGGSGNATAGTDTSGQGGIGIASSITGTRTEYGSGGGGGKRGTGSGGPGGVIAGLVTAGGAGGRDAAGSPGVSGRGGGGGGAGRNTEPPVGDAIGGPGGAGIVVVRYALPS
jgi:hypothetical protein